jgi:hypothetical protein
MSSARRSLVGAARAPFPRLRGVCQVAWLVAAWVALLGAAAPPTTGADPCDPPPALSARAARLVRPVLQEVLRAHAVAFDSAGSVVGDALRYQAFEERFDRLLGMKGPAADEAIAALMCFYLGEASADGIVCEAINRGPRIVPYLRRFLRCPPRTGLEPIPPFFTDIPNFREEVLDRIEAGETKCAYDD